MVSTRPASGTSSLTFVIAFSKDGPEISVIKMLAPSLANKIEVSKPIPLNGYRVNIGRPYGGRNTAHPAAPVMIAFFPLNLPGDDDIVKLIQRRS